MININAIPTLVAAISVITIGIFVIVKNIRSRGNRSFFLLTLSTFLWQIGTTLALAATEPQTALFGTRIGFLGIVFIPITTYQFVLNFLGIGHERRRIIIFGYLINLLFFIPLSWTSYMFNGVYKFRWGYWYKAGVLHPLFLVFFGSFMFLNFCQLYIVYKKEKSPFEKNRKKYLSIALLIAYISIEDYLPTYGLNIYPFGYLAVIGSILIIAYAIVKHHLLDIKIAITRAGIFLVIYALVLGVPFWVGYTLLGRGIWVSVFLFGMILASLGPFAYNYLQRKAENALLKEQKHYQKALKDFASTIIFIKDVKELTQKVVSKIMASVEVQFCAIYLKEPNDFYLAQHEPNISPDLPSKISLNSEFINYLANITAPLLGEFLPKVSNIRLGLVAPLFLKQELCGVIMLGPKEAGFFTDTDLDAFTILANQTSLALSEIYYFEEYQKTTEDKYKLILEKERLESAFEIAEAYRHEVGNAVQMISLNADNFLSDTSYKPSQEELLKSLRSITKNANRAQNVLNAVSNYNKKAKTEFKTVALDKIVNEAIKKQEASISDKGITLQKEMEDEIQVLGNENLQEAVRYLIEGAVQAIEYFLPKEKLISVKLGNKDNSAVLEVADTGNAVLSDTLYKGVGIERGKEGGIYYFIARRIIFDHKGKFEIKEFNNKQGTRFMIEIPLRRE